MPLREAIQTKNGNFGQDEKYRKGLRIATAARTKLRMRLVPDERGLCGQLIARDFLFGPEYPHQMAQSDGVEDKTDGVVWLDKAQ